MKKKIANITILILFLIFNKECLSKSIHQEQQYKIKLVQDSEIIQQKKINKKLINTRLFLIQIQNVKTWSPSLYLKYKSTYMAVINWLKKNSHINEFNKFGIDAIQMKGVDNYGNVKISGYYTPIIQVRKNKKNNFIYPIYSMPTVSKKNQSLPQRKDIYNGVLDKKYILAYSNSLINNFIMEIQGSAFVDYGDNKPFTFFSYSGTNGWPYKSIGQVLINRGDIQKQNMSMKTIKIWCQNHTKTEIKTLFEENTSFVFFKKTKKKQVYGASLVPLVGKASIAADSSIVKNGSVLLVQIPKLNKYGIFKNEYQMRLVIALDVGGAIKGQHFDMYEGIGKKAGISAGFYNHYGHAWILKKIIKHT